MIHEVVPAEALLERALQVSDAYGRIPPRSFRLTKEQLRRPTIERIEHASPTVDPHVLAARVAPEVHAAMRAFVESTIGAR